MYWKKSEGHGKVCVTYLCKFNEAVVGVPLLLICPIFTGHNLADVTDGHEDTFFIVLHRTHEDISQVLHQLNLKGKWDYFPQMENGSNEASAGQVSPSNIFTWSSRFLGVWQQPKSEATWLTLPIISTASTAANASCTAFRHWENVRFRLMQHSPARTSSPYLYWASNHLIGETQPNSLKKTKENHNFKCLSITFWHRTSYSDQSSVFWWCINTLVFLDARLHYVGVGREVQRRPDGSWRCHSSEHQVRKLQEEHRHETGRKSTLIMGF